MAEKVDPQVIDALSISNVKTIAEASAIAMANLYQHQSNHARRLDILAEAHLGKVLTSFSSVDPHEAVATAKLFKGEADSGISSLLAQLAAGQVSTKIAQSTPGDLGQELSKLTASIVAMQSQFSGLIASLQQQKASGKAA
jgi:hypothetical protein